MTAGSVGSISKRGDRPATLVVAIALAVAIQIGGIPFNFVPGSEEAPTFAVVISVIASVLILSGSWGMWNRRKWGAILVLVVTGLSTLASIPGFFDPPSNWILAAVIIFVPLSLVDMALIVLPSSWRAFDAE